MKKLPKGEYDRKAGGGWSRARLIAMDQRYCEAMRAGLGDPASGHPAERPAARTDDPGR